MSLSHVCLLCSSSNCWAFKEEPLHSLQLLHLFCCVLWR